MNSRLESQEENVISLTNFRQASAHFRPCGVEDEFLDDPLEDLLNEFEFPESEQEFLTEDPPTSFWSDQHQQDLGLKDIMEEATHSMTPIQRLRFSMIKTKKSLKELHYYNRELKIFLGL